ncbi:MAG: hypothetical protein AB7Q17_01190 [Phycisphaerae bacterium]
MGCAPLTYRSVQVGQTPAEYQRLIPAEQSRRTDVGVCSLATDPFGRVDALALLLTTDRRVSGKLHATHETRSLGLQTETRYALRGEFDPELAALGKTGPTDALRAIADDLASYRGERQAMDAYAWVAAGLVRLLQRWPNVDPAAMVYPNLADTLDRVPAGGVATMRIRADGRFEFEYTQRAHR